MATTERLMETFTQVSQVTPTQPSVYEKLAILDLKLPGITGSKSDSANYIEPAFDLPLLIWSCEVRTVLAASGLSHRQQSFSIIHAVTVAARRSFFRAYELDIDTTTAVKTLNKLCDPGRVQQSLH